MKSEKKNEKKQNLIWFFIYQDIFRVSDVHQYPIKMVFIVHFNGAILSNMNNLFLFDENTTKKFTVSSKSLNELERIRTFAVPIEIGMLYPI